MELKKTLRSDQGLWFFVNLLIDFPSLLTAINRVKEPLGFQVKI